MMAGTTAFVEQTRARLLAAVQATGTSYARGQLPELAGRAGYDDRVGLAPVAAGPVRTPLLMSGPGPPGRSSAVGAAPASARCPRKATP